jgi:uncharacterized protein
VPALLTTLASFALILLLVRLRAPLAVAIVAGAAALGLALGLPAARVAAAAAAALVEPLTIGVLVTVFVLQAISELMQTTGRTREIVALAGAFLRRPAVTMAALPALIGLLPMPGGALFSAPMVASAAAGSGSRGDLLSAINYWFRHPWEYFWPLYPGVILAMTLTHTSLAEFSALQAPLGVTMAVAGLTLFRGTRPELHVSAPAPPAGTKRRLLAATAPIWIILLGWMAVTGALRVLLPPPGSDEVALAVDRFLPVTVALLASLAWIITSDRTALPALPVVLLRRSLWVQTGLVAAVMVYQHVLGAAGAPPRIAAELTAHHLPVMLVVVALPALAGMITGVALGFVGASFPIVLGLVAALPGSPSALPWAVLAYAAGHLGMMLSPIHLCYVVSNRYFETPFGPVYRHLWLPAVITGTVAVVYFGALQALFR